MAHIDMKIRRSPIQTINLLEVAYKAIEYQWSMEQSGRGIERWTPDHTQYMSSRLEHIENLIADFTQYRTKELLKSPAVEIHEIENREWLRNNS